MTDLIVLIAVAPFILCALIALGWAFLVAYIGACGIIQMGLIDPVIKPAIAWLRRLK